MTTLLSVSPTTALSTTTGTVYYYGRRQIDRAACIQGNFTYGSGGTSFDAYVQTSMDGGNTWTDIAQFHWMTSSARAVYNLSSLTVHTSAITPTDGSLSANSAVDGAIGDRLRVKYQSAGTYSTTSVAIDCITDQLTTYP